MPLHPPAPSHDVLSLLAVLSPQHTGTPDFLCPYPCQTQPQSARKRRARRSASASTSTSTPFYRSSAVPPKYEQGADGNWRPASAWTLHGVLVCAPVFSPPVSPRVLTGHASVLLERIRPPPAIFSTQISKNQTMSTEMAMALLIQATKKKVIKLGPIVRPHQVTLVSPRRYHVTRLLTPFTAALYDQISASLPTGWTPPPPRTKFYSVPVIIVISLIIAIVVTLLITAVVLTRKTRRRSRTFTDIEKEANSDNEANQDLSVALKCARKKGKLWERWRRQSQGKLGLRKRWRRPAVRVDEVHDDDPTPRPSFSSSRSRVSSIHSEGTPAERDSTNHVLSPPEPSPPPLSPPPPTIYPPAYQWRRRSFPGTRIASVPLPNALATGSVDQDTLVNGIPLRAHVATDDKAVLEQMRQGASAPESTPTATAISSLNVPLWEDEQLEDFNDDTHSIGGADHDWRSPLPPPLPSVRYIHRHLDNPESMPIAFYLAEPPAAAGPSAPPSDDAGGLASLTPSAPPLQDSEEDLRPSAPMLEEDHEEEQEDGTDLYGSITEQRGTATRAEVPQQRVRRPRGRERAQRESVVSAASLPLYEP